MTLDEMLTLEEHMRSKERRLEVAAQIMASIIPHSISVAWTAEQLVNHTIRLTDALIEAVNEPAEPQ
jgi:hypothetical protein